MNLERSEIGKDHQKAAGERRCHRSAAPTIRHACLRAVLIPTAVGCCPSAARRTTHRGSPFGTTVCSGRLLPRRARPVAVGSIPDSLSNVSSIAVSVGTWHDPDLSRPIAAPLQRCAQLLGVDLATIQEAAANVEPYIRADGTRIWSLMQLERQLRPEVYAHRRGGYLDRRRTRP
jgi:hypothetical protein